MRKASGWLLAFCICALAVILATPLRSVIAGQSSVASPPTAQPDPYETAVKPILRANCVGCHNPDKLKGDLDLQQFLSVSGADCAAEAPDLELVLQKLRAGEMPPPGKPRPTPEQVAAAELDCSSSTPCRQQGSAEPGTRDRAPPQSL